MVKGKSWAIFAACAVVATASLVRAEEAPASASSEFTLSKPLTMQAAPSRKPLMWLLDQAGLATPLEDAGINIGGHVEASTTFYADKDQNAKLQPARSFDAEDQDPTLNQVMLFVEKTVDLSQHAWDVGGRFEVMWGGDARFIHSTGLGDHQGLNDGPDEQFDITQAYLDLATPWDFRLRVGKFVTMAGYETINPTTTPLYSRGLLFNFLLPFTHTGVLGTYVAGDWTFDAGVIRGWDDALEDKNNDGLSYIGRVSYAFPDKKQAVYVTGIFGPEYPDSAHGGFDHANHDNRLLIDVVYTYKWSDEWSFAGQADILWESDLDGNTPGSNDSQDGLAGGLGAWATYTPPGIEYLQVNGRLEYLYDGQGFRFFGGIPDGEGGNVYSATIGLTITPFYKDEIGSNLKIRPELRADYSDDQEVFGGGEDHLQLSAGIEGYFTF